MTLDQINSMSPEEINVSIAEHCGWRWMKLSEGFLWFSKLDEGKYETVNRPDTWRNYSLSHLPNYHGSLDAMKQAEDTLTKADRYSYYLNLREIALQTDPLTYDDPLTHILAPASVRSIAFLMVKEGAR